MTRPSAQYWIQYLQLKCHIEGGWYGETYRSPLLLDKDQLSQGFNGDRNACTHIYFLLEIEQFSAFHRIRSDELWHFYSGDQFIIYEISKDGTMTTHRLGNDPEKGDALCCVIRAGNWFASQILKGGEYGLAGCTVSPGFDFEDFEMADGEKLIQEFPAHSEIIRTLSKHP